MDRLTFEGNFCDIAQCREQTCPYNGSCSQREVWERLKAYEDTGCEPEEVLPKEKADEIALNLMRLTDLEGLAPYDHLRELAEADKAGRVVVLPCKVGDTVYQLFCGNQKNPVISTLKINTVSDAVGLIKRMGLHKYFGVFLTREEAEAALSAKEGQA